MVAGLLSDYPLQGPDYIWDNITPRQAVYLLEYSFKLQAKRDMRMVSIFHSENPRDLHKEFQRQSGINKVIKLKEGQELSGVLRLATLLGTPEQISGIQEGQSKLDRRRRILKYLDEPKGDI